MLFRGNYTDVGGVHDYDVALDDQEFLMMKESEPAPEPTQINVILNWFEELKRLFPTESD